MASPSTEGAGARETSWPSKRAWIVLAAVVAVGLALDLISKELAFDYVAGVPVELTRAQVLRHTHPIRGGGVALDIDALIPPHPPVHVVPGLLDFTLVLNPGAVFGIGAGRRWVFVGFTGVALAFAVWMFGSKTRPRDWGAHVAIGLLIAGGLGNLYDRLVFASVRDFLHPLPGVLLPFGIAWPGGSREVWPYVSNVADLLLLIGIGILMVHIWRADRPRTAEQADREALERRSGEQKK